MKRTKKAFYCREENAPWRKLEYSMQQFYGLGGLDHNLLRVALATFLEVRGSTYPAIVAAKANQRCCGLFLDGDHCANNRHSDR